MTQRKTCPKCSHQRRGRNRNDKCLKIFDNGNEFCHHCGYDSTKDKSEWVPSPDYKPYKKPSQDLPQVTSVEFRELMAERGISHEVVKRNKISWNGKEVMFPYFYDGEIFNIKYRDLDKKFRQEAGAMKGFYGLDDIVGKKDIYIVEGEFDKLACEEAGFLNVVSVPDGAPTVKSKDFHTKFEFIDNWMHLLDEAERIIIAVDNDEPGVKLEQELIRRFDPEKCWTVSWPDKCKDANQVLVNHGILTLMGCLDEPKRVPLSGIFEATDFANDYFDLYDNGLKGGEETGWHELDKCYTVRPGDLCIITGTPGHGKSTWLNALLVNLANLNGWRFGVFSPENEPMSRYNAMISQLKLGKPFRDGVTPKMTRIEAGEGLSWANKHFYFIKPEYTERTAPCLIEKSKMLVKRYGINGVFFDPWNLINKANRSSGQSETEHILESLEAFKSFARDYNVATWIVAHPNKPLKEPGGSIPVPGAYDISGSAHWFNVADNILTVWRNPKEKLTPSAVHIQKVRFPEVGQAGHEVNFYFNAATGRFIEVKEIPDVTAVQEKPTQSKPTKKDDEHYFQHNFQGRKEW